MSRGRKPTGVGSVIPKATRDAIVVRLRTGERPRDIARACWVSHETVYSLARHLCLPTPRLLRRQQRNLLRAQHVAASPAGRFVAAHGAELGVALTWNGSRVEIRRIGDWAPVRFYWPRTPWRCRDGRSYYRANVQPGVVGILILPDGRYVVSEPRPRLHAVYVPAECESSSHRRAA